MLLMEHGYRDGDISLDLEMELLILEGIPGFETRPAFLFDKGLRMIGQKQGRGWDIGIGLPEGAIWKKRAQAVHAKWK